MGWVGWGHLYVHSMPSKSPSQGLNLLLISQELQEVVGSGRNVSGLMGGVPVVNAEQGTPEALDSSNGPSSPASSASQRYRVPHFLKPVVKLRRSCDRCTSRKIRCDGNGDVCKRCVGGCSVVCLEKSAVVAPSFALLPKLR